MEKPVDHKYPGVKTITDHERISMVKEIFSTITKKYDFLNHLLSLRRDVAWRRFAIKKMFFPNTGRFLDVACGTGDLSIGAALKYPQIHVTGVDFVPEMIRVGKRKVEKRGLSARITLLHGDALSLPVPDDAFDVTGMAFGIRNIPDKQKALEEMLRATAPGGQIMILEMTFVQNRFFKLIYYVYLNYLLPFFAKVFSANPAAYHYLADSIMNFPSPDAFAKLMEEAGTTEVEKYPLTFGITWLHIGKKPGTGGMMNKAALQAWLQASRLPFYVATFIPLFIGWILAIKQESLIRPWRFLLVFLGSFMVHLLTNLANDYFDHLVGTDSGEAIGGSRVIQEGKIAPRTMFRVIMTLYILAFAIAFIIIFAFKLYLLAVPILFAAFSSYFYVAPPIRYGYYGLGELFVGINMGPIMIVGTYWVIAGQADVIPLLISIPVGLMVASILYYQSLPDMKTDEAAGKHTLAVRLGKRGAFWGLVLFFVLIYLSILLLVVYGLLSWYSLAFCISILFCVKLIGIVIKTDDWVLLDQYGKYVRIIYFINGISIIAGIWR